MSAESESEYIMECESCGELYEGKDQINRWMEETEVFVPDGENELVWHCRANRCWPENAVRWFHQ